MTETKDVPEWMLDVAAALADTADGTAAMVGLMLEPKDQEAVAATVAAGLVAAIPMGKVSAYAAQTASQMMAALPLMNDESVRVLREDFDIRLNYERAIVELERHMRQTDDPVNASALRLLSLLSRTMQEGKHELLTRATRAALRVCLHRPHPDDQERVGPEDARPALRLLVLHALIGKAISAQSARVRRQK